MSLKFFCLIHIGLIILKAKVTRIKLEKMEKKDQTEIEIKK